MKLPLAVAAMIVLAAFVSGCVSRAPATAVRVTGMDIEDIVPVRIGDFDTYTADFRIENPSNQTFSNVEVTFRLVPTTTFCHQQVQTVTIPAVRPLDRKTERFSFSEFADLNCGYTYSYEVTSEVPFRLF